MEDAAYATSHRRINFVIHRDPADHTDHVLYVELMMSAELGYIFNLIQFYIPFFDIA